MLDDAIQVVISEHDGQHRDKVDGVALPYAVHPIEVMKRLFSWGIRDEEILTIALFHDLLEDTNVSASFIAHDFGSMVLDRVVELTFVPNPHEKKKESKKKYLESFRKKSVEALVVKIADRICNLEDTFVSNPNYTKKYFDKAQPLWDITRNRRQDIVDAFGEDCYFAICSDYNKICNQLNEKEKGKKEMFF
jgi:(p)ppGpp synthase/HD superfamily hydrolase